MTPLSFMLSKMPTSSPENGVSTQHVTNIFRSQSSASASVQQTGFHLC